MAFDTFLAPWADWYGRSTATSTAVTSLHLAGMLLGGGFAIAVDRATLRALAGRGPALTSHLTELDTIHRPVMLGLGITTVTGLLMLAADLDHLLASPVFWIKMGILSLLIANGWILGASGRAASGFAPPEHSLRRLRVTALASSILWFVALALGAILPSV